MAGRSESVWAIDIGNSSLKALRLSTERGALEVADFENIRHGKILAGSGVTQEEREELIALSLRRFVDKHDLSMDEVVVSVPSQNSFARFVNLPPVEKKRIAEIVKFEAVQQIPFDINEVQWDWQLMSEEESTELKVGIFAIKNEVIDSLLEHYLREDIQVSYVQIAPMALYNYILYDRPSLVSSDEKAAVILNVGAEITDLVVCTKSSVWQRCIMMGGNSFTRAIADTFRLDFEKAEKLKRTAPVSKYARQIFQAMRPVFTEMASEIQRSLGFFKSSNPNTRVVRVIGLGGGTKLRGLLKYLQQTLQMPVERPDTFKRLAIGPGVPAAKFGGNVSEFGVVYGLALQGLGLGRLENNLLPRSMVRSKAWAGKSRWFVFAACMLLVVSVMSLGRTVYDRISYSAREADRAKIAQVLRASQEANRKLVEAETRINEYKSGIEKEFALFKYREVIPRLHEMIIGCLPNSKNSPQDASLHAAFERGDVQSVMAVPRKDRRQLFVTNMSVYYSSDLARARFGQRSVWRVTGLEVGLEEEEFWEEEEEEFNIYQPDIGGVEEEEKFAGFVVTLVGYSPYKDIETLIDPPGVEDRPDRWGLVTRLMHLDDLVADGNSPFELYMKTDPSHFKLDVGEVAVRGKSMPGVIGEPSVIYTMMRTGEGTISQRPQTVLLDPMTKEIISKRVIRDENGRPILHNGQPVYEINDRWFVLNFKLTWKGRDAAGAAGRGLAGL